MKLRHPGLIGLVALLASCVIRFWIRTLRYHMVYLDGKMHPTDARVDPHIYAFWHEALLFPTAFKARSNILISQHRDGELIARVCKHLGAGVVRGIHHARGAMAGLMGMVLSSRTTHLLITPDGPCGPRRRFQIGAILLASMTGLPLVPVGLTFAPTWRVSSWDCLLLPKPWGAAYGIIGMPLYVPPNLGRQDLEPIRQQVEKEMARLTEAAERWAQGGTRPRPAINVQETKKVAA